MGSDPDGFDDGEYEEDLESLGFRVSAANIAGRAGSSLVSRAGDNFELELTMAIEYQGPI